MDWVTHFPGHLVSTGTAPSPTYGSVRPLTSTEALAVSLSELSDIRYLDASARALELCVNGAASPAEAQAYLLLCANRRLGGEGFPKPKLNMRIDYSPAARRLVGRSFAVADCLWPEPRKILEVNGEAFHANSDGFLVETARRPALESMGYTVAEVTPAQMADLSLFDTMLPVIAEKLGFPLKRPTAAFLRARDRLHHELFSCPYEPAWTGSRRLKSK